MYYLSQEERRRLRTKIEEILRGQEKVEFAYLYGSFIEDLPLQRYEGGFCCSSLNQDLVRNRCQEIEESSERFGRLAHFTNIIAGLL